MINDRDYTQTKEPWGSRQTVLGNVVDYYVHNRVLWIATRDKGIFKVTLEPLGGS